MSIDPIHLTCFLSYKVLEDGKPKIFLFKTKIASNDCWLFLLIEFHVFMPEEFLKGIYNYYLFLPTLLSLCKIGN